MAIVKSKLIKELKKAYPNFLTQDLGKIINVKIKNRNLRYKLPLTFSRDLIGEKIVKISRITKTKISRIGKILSKKKFKFRLLNADKVLNFTKIPGYEHLFT